MANVSEETRAALNEINKKLLESGDPAAVAALLNKLDAKGSAEALALLNAADAAAALELASAEKAASILSELAKSDLAAAAAILEQARKFIRQLLYHVSLIDSTRKCDSILMFVFFI